MKAYQKHIHVILILLIALLAASGCTTGAGPATPEVEAEPAEEFSPIVSATGVVAPIQWSNLSMQTSGVIEELPVEANQIVEKGQLLVRLEGKESLTAAVAAASFELFSAERALEVLYENPELKVAQAWQEVIDLRQAVDDAQDRVDNLGEDAEKSDIDIAKANVALAKVKLDKAEEDFKPFRNKPESNIRRAALLSKLAQAQKVYDNAVRVLNNLTGDPNELTRSDAEAALALAKAQLAVAEQKHAELLNGADPDDVEAAQERIKNARAQLAASVAALENIELRAPFAGAVSELNVRLNEWVTMGQPVLLLADLQQLRVETTDLNEIDVARVREGDLATVTFDALPGVEVTGRVIRIALKSAPGSGVNYKVTIELNEIPEGLRWGMTAFVDITVGQ